MRHGFSFSGLRPFFYCCFYFWLFVFLHDTLFIFFFSFGTLTVHKSLGFNPLAISMGSLSFFVAAYLFELTIQFLFTFWGVFCFFNSIFKLIFRLREDSLNLF